MASTATFEAPAAFTLVVQSPPNASVSFSGGPSSTIDVEVNETVTFPALTTTLTNTGETAGVFSISVVSTSSSGSLTWSGNGSGISLAAGASASVTWNLSVTAGSTPSTTTYQTYADVSWT